MAVKCCVVWSLLARVGTHVKRSVSWGPGTSSLAFCCFLLCGEKRGLWFYFPSHPAPASAGSPGLPTRREVGGVGSSGSQLLELKIPQR